MKVLTALILVLFELELVTAFPLANKQLFRREPLPVRFPSLFRFRTPRVRTTPKGSSPKGSSPKGARANSPGRAPNLGASQVARKRIDSISRFDKPKNINRQTRFEFDKDGQATGRSFLNGKEQPRLIDKNISDKKAFKDAQKGAAKADGVTLKGEKAAKAKEAEAAKGHMGTANQEMPTLKKDPIAGMDIDDIQHGKKPYEDIGSGSSSKGSGSRSPPDSFGDFNSKDFE